MVSRTLFWKYDLASLSYSYGKFDRDFVAGEGKLKTSGSSTTVTTISTSGVLKDVKIGDLVLMVRDPYVSTGTDLVKIATKASNDSMTVSSAVNWDNSAAGYAPWRYLVAEVPATGTAAGWFHVGGFTAKTVFPVITTLASDTIDITVEAKDKSGVIATVYTESYSSATAPRPIPVGEDIEFLRVGVKAGASFAGTDVFDCTFTGRPR